MNILKTDNYQKKLKKKNVSTPNHSNHPKWQTKQISEEEKKKRAISERKSLENTLTGARKNKYPFQ